MDRPGRTETNSKEDVMRNNPNLQAVFEVTLRQPEGHMPISYRIAHEQMRSRSLLFTNEDLILPSLQVTYCTMKGVLSIEDKRAEGGMFVVKHEDGRADIFDVCRRHIYTMPEHF